MVEAPGTAPGSVTLITLAVYHHRWLPITVNIGLFNQNLKGKIARITLRQASFENQVNLSQFTFVV